MPFLYCDNNRVNINREGSFILSGLSPVQKKQIGTISSRYLFLREDKRVVEQDVPNIYKTPGGGCSADNGMIKFSASYNIFGNRCTFRIPNGSNGLSYNRILLYLKYERIGNANLYIYTNSENKTEIIAGDYLTSPFIYNTSVIGTVHLQIVAPWNDRGDCWIKYIFYMYNTTPLTFYNFLNTNCYKRTWTPGDEEYEVY